MRDKNDLDELLQRIRGLVLKGQTRRSNEISKLIKQCHPLIVHAAAKILNSPGMRYSGQDAEDVAQHFWVIMFLVGFRRYDPTKGPIVGYAYTIIRNRCRDGRRRRRPISLSVDVKDRGKAPEVVAMKREWDAQLRAAVRRLPKNYRRAFLLKYKFLVSSAVGAQRCEVGVDTFNTWVYQARQILKRTLKSEDWLDAA